MTSDTIKTLTTNFESFVNKTDEKIEFWFELYEEYLDDGVIHAK